MTPLRRPFIARAYMVRKHFYVPYVSYPCVYTYSVHITGYQPISPNTELARERTFRQGAKRIASPPSQTYVREKRVNPSYSRG